MRTGDGAGTGYGVGLAGWRGHRDPLLIPTENRRLKEAAELFRKGNHTFRGAFQVSIFDNYPAEMNS